MSLTPAHDFQQSEGWQRYHLGEDSTWKAHVDGIDGEKTYSRVVERALEDFVRRIKARRILELRGSGLWEGDLAQMRRDQEPARRKAK